MHSRAYIAFKTEEFVARFSREYDGHIFKDKAGTYSLYLWLGFTMSSLVDTRDRIASGGRICTLSEVAAGEEKGR